MVTKTQKRVVIIGAGPSGLVSAKHALTEGHDVVVFEQNDKVGGLWYPNDPKGHSPMYEGLRTNLPKEMMVFEGAPYDEKLPSYITSDQFLNYLKTYSEGLPIQFNTTVIQIEPLENLWKVTLEVENITKTQFFDVVFVCNGHSSKPRIPFKFDKFKGKIIHSIDYRRACDFKGLRVAVIGTGTSGTDVALQLSEVAPEVHLIGRRATHNVLPENVIQFQAHVTEIMENGILLDDGREIEDIVAIIICTGYKLNFPFLNKEIIQITGDGWMVSPLWQYVVHMKYPRSLFFIGLSYYIVTMTIFEHQAKFALSMVAGRADIPSYNEMKEWETKRLQYLKENGRLCKEFHVLGYDQWNYMANLAELGKFAKCDRHKVMQKMYKYITEGRIRDVMGYRNVKFEIEGDEYRVIDI